MGFFFFYFRNPTVVLMINSVLWLVDIISQSDDQIYDLCQHLNRFFVTQLLMAALFKIKLVIMMCEDGSQLHAFLIPVNAALSTITDSLQTDAERCLNV